TLAATGRPADAASAPRANAPAALPAVEQAIRETSTGGGAAARDERGARLMDLSDRAGAREDGLRLTGATTQPGAGRWQATAMGRAGGEAADGAIAIKPWDPNTPYIQAMKRVPAEGAYAVYLEQRPANIKSPAFFFDCADYLVRAGRKAEGIRVLTDVVELQLEDARLARVVAHRLQQIGELDAAIDLFERVLALRPEEPQSYRDLALALADRADAAVAAKRADLNTAAVATDYARALELLGKVVERNWDRFEQIELIALMEANRIAERVKQLPNFGDVPNPIDGRLRKNLDCDVRIVLTWDADQTDIDLWVTEPSGETCIYNHNRTTIGGAMSRDFTQGYGPEEYALRRVMPGQYKIQANYYGSNQAHLTGPCTVQATVITNFGRPNEQRQTLSLRLGQNKETATVGTVTLGQPAEMNK
ncbi:MAG TPA: DUF2135 domain-containing protein, partial [Humisphaera sp.]